MNLMSVINNVEGRMQPDECVKLNELAKKIDGDIVEIGSLFGKSTICLALGLKRHKVYAIDPHIGPYGTVDKSSSFEKFKDNIEKAGVKDKVVPIVMTSESAFKEGNVKSKKIGMIWIDGNHDYDYVKKDFEIWSTVLKPNGIIAFHDFSLSEPGVVKVVFEVCKKMKFDGLQRNIVWFSNGKTGLRGKTKLFLRLLKEPQFIFSIIYIYFKKVLLGNRKNLT